MNNKYALIVEDDPLKHESLSSILKELGFNVSVCQDADSAEKILRRDDRHSLVMVDKQILEAENAQHPEEWVGAYLLLKVAKEFPFISHLVLYTHLSEPNVGDIRQVYMAGASALAAPPNTDRQTFVKALEMVTLGHQILSPRFKHFGAQALEPEAQCPFDPVEYYCIRLIAEHRGKEGVVEKWGKVSINNIDDLLDDIYVVMSGKINDFNNLSRDKKSFQLGKWYHDIGVKMYGAAYPVDYEPRSQRRKKSSWNLDNPGQ